MSNWKINGICWYTGAVSNLHTMVSNENFSPSETVSEPTLLNVSGVMIDVPKLRKFGNLMIDVPLKYKLGAIEIVGSTARAIGGDSPDDNEILFSTWLPQKMCRFYLEIFEEAIRYPLGIAFDSSLGRAKELLKGIREHFTSDQATSQKVHGEFKDRNQHVKDLTENPLFNLYLDKLAEGSDAIRKKHLDPDTKGQELESFIRKHLSGYMRMVEASLQHIYSGSFAHELRHIKEFEVDGVDQSTFPLDLNIARATSSTIIPGVTGLLLAQTISGNMPPDILNKISQMGLEKIYSVILGILPTWGFIYGAMLGSSQAGDKKVSGDDEELENLGYDFEYKYQRFSQEAISIDRQKLWKPCIKPGSILEEALEKATKTQK